MVCREEEETKEWMKKDENCRKTSSLRRLFLACPSIRFEMLTPLSCPVHLTRRKMLMSELSMNAGETFLWYRTWEKEKKGLDEKADARQYENGRRQKRNLKDYLARQLEPPNIERDTRQAFVGFFVSSWKCKKTVRMTRHFISASSLAYLNSR